MLQPEPRHGSGCNTLSLGLGICKYTEKILIANCTDFHHAFVLSNFLFGGTISQLVECTSCQKEVAGSNLTIDAELCP